MHPYTYFIPNAADFKHSEKALQDSTPIYSELHHLKRPIVGYFGNIERRLDYKMIHEVMRMNLDKTFVFVGPVEPEFLKKISPSEIPNLKLISRVPYDEMPNVIKGFDVAIIPFKKDEVSYTIFPLKLFEYLGSGKPVVSTNFNTHLNEFTFGTVPFCTNANEFSEAINDALENDTPQKKQERLNAAKENTWDRRLTEFSNILEEYYHKKG